MTGSVDTSELWRQIAAASRASAAAKEAALVPLVDRFVTVLLMISPADTNRYKRGWVDAANKAGLAPRPLPEIRESKRAALYLEALEKQAAQALKNYQHWDRLERLYMTTGRTGQPYYRKIKTQKAKMLRRYDKAIEQLNLFNEHEGALFFDRGGYVYGDPRFLKGGHLQRFSSIRHKLYGGRASVLRAGDRVAIELVNMEPHSAIVERVARHGHPVRSAMHSVRHLGLTSVSDRYLRALYHRGVVMAKTGRSVAVGM